MPEDVTHFQASVARHTFNLMLAARLAELAGRDDRLSIDSNPVYRGTLYRKLAYPQSSVEERMQQEITALLSDSR